MKKIIKLLFVITMAVALANCKKEESFDTNIQSYDLRDPGLYNEQVGEVKWIFCLKYGETKYLDIDGEMYKITLNDLYRTWLDLYNYRFYAFLKINGDEISVNTSKYFSMAYTGEEGLKEYILIIYDTISECFSSKSPLDSFINEFSEGSLINNSLDIYINSYQYISSAVDADPIGEFRVIFTIIKKNKDEKGDFN